MQGKRAVLIYNPNSGRGKAAMRATDFFQHWEDRTGTELRLRPTRSLPDIRVAAKEIQPDELPIFMGGDGTLSESLQGLAEAAEFRQLKQPIGFLPGGTGNSFLRDFGITDYDAARDALLSAIAADQSLAVDAGIVEYTPVPGPAEKSAQSGATPGAVSGERARRITMNIWAVGLIPDITELAIRMRAIGSLNYTLASLIKLLGHKPERLKVIVDGQEREVECNFICISNSRFTGGAMEIAPAVRVNDGRLFYLCPEVKGRLKSFGLFPSIFKGKHIEHPNITTDFVQSIALNRPEPFLMNVDGELERGLNPGVTIQPGYFRLYMDPERVA
ncbi:MAG: hypothetical protein NXI24_10905 [bacterium]|nr:hypothetical protein [bacterium]